MELFLNAMKQPKSRSKNMNRIKYVLTQDSKLSKEHLMLGLPQRSLRPSCPTANRPRLTPSSRNQSLDLKGMSRIGNYSTSSYYHSEHNRRSFQNYFKKNMSTRSKLSSQSSHHNQFLSTSGHNLRRNYALSSTDSYPIKDSSILSQKLFEEGKSLLEMKNSIEAISLFDRAFQLDPAKVEALLYLSLIHICRCRRYAVCRSRWSPYH
eukprot:TRINITY_DN15222_c0_g3_i1.p1 TRINITY_DN15222_c0_g3~~TRINITY_DN15222_c0_g3_i1.p1  ORF type:complete len:216 (-),score=32.66 TRINITY_DN15222_c0_g3_i1:15-638(-)